ncbi:SH3 domain-containing protein [Winslowiella toletana]|uniref:SH3 domain-containing protein n=1 Tax=Winslowiella toletana TaxID=92490 RepID=UPI0036F1A7A3
MTFTRITVKIRIALTLLAVLVVAGCQAPPPPLTDDSLVTSEVAGVTLTHRYAVQAPQKFKPVNQTWRALYKSSVMTTPDYSGKIVGYLDSGKPFTVLGTVENHWLAIADEGQQQLVGYVPLKAGVPSERYDATVQSDRPRPRKAARQQVCVDVGGDSKACRSKDTATWILD